MADTVISTSGLRNSEGSIRDVNARMYGTLTDIKDQVNGLKSSYSSEGAEEIINNMNNMQARFDEYKSIVESYAKHLDEVADRFIMTEGTIKSRAEMFRA